MNHLFRFLLLSIHLLLSINGLIGGLLLMIKPDGSMLQMDPTWLDKTPFHNYFLPGFLLFTFVGLLSLITLLGLIFKFNAAFLNRVNIYPDKHWAWTYSLYSGFSTIIWITVQLILTKYFWLQPVILFIGTGILICTLVPGVIKYYASDNPLIPS